MCQFMGQEISFLSAIQRNVYSRSPTVGDGVEIRRSNIDDNRPRGRNYFALNRRNVAKYRRQPSTYDNGS